MTRLTRLRATRLPIFRNRLTSATSAEQESPAISTYWTRLPSEPLTRSLPSLPLCKRAGRGKRQRKQGMNEQDKHPS
jgi:hypothetical protein